MLTAPVTSDLTLAGQWFLARSDLDLLIQALRGEGRRVIGPRVSDGAIVYDDIEAATDLPHGWRDEQTPGRYRLVESASERVFDYAVGPTSWKRFVFPARLPITVAHRDGAVGFEQPAPDVRPLAFLGVRACELAALAIEDRVFLGGPFIDADFAARRDSAFIVAVQCTTAASTCFCTSVSTGPEVRGGYDILLTEIEDGFVVHAGSAHGKQILDTLPTRRAAHAEIGESFDEVEAVREAMGTPLPLEGIHDRLLAQYESPRWQQIAERCLECVNCTLSCPTCFCTSVVTRSDLDGAISTNERIWDSCFDADFARVAGGDFRSRPRDRYRQWLTHKFATWQDQFGSLGCVGCGRCITWCPVGIDIREELMAVAPPQPPVEKPVPVTPAAGNIGAYTQATVAAVKFETHDAATLSLTNMDPAFLAGRPGQFVMVALPAFPAVPISISRFRPDGIDLTIRSVGPTSTALCSLKKGATVGVRGPLGTFWPIDEAYGKHVVIVGGGVGLPPLRGLVETLLDYRERFETVSLYYGARTPQDRMYVSELETWSSRSDIEVAMTVDRAGPEWKGRVGVVTTLFDQMACDCRRVVAYVVGPERMMQATIQTLLGKGVAPNKIFVSMERHMECGIGLCGHCQMGKYFVCKDGPVFRLTDLSEILNREGI